MSIKNQTTGNSATHSNMRNYTDKVNEPKFAAGQNARDKYSKLPIIYHSRSSLINMKDFNKNICDNSFIKAANIKLDESKNLQVLKPNHFHENWSKDVETIYTIVIKLNDVEYILKFGGTRTNMSKRWGSYTAGRSSTSRKDGNGKFYSGTQSETNSYIHDTIEDGILRGYEFSFWVFNLPKMTKTVNIFGKDIIIEAQTYHGYESRIIELYKSISGGVLPLLCDNADPKYR